MKNAILLLIAICLSLAIGSVLPCAYAVEVTPAIGFNKMQMQAPNGSHYDPNNPYKTRTPGDSSQVLNQKLFSQNQVTKMVPDINSVGLDFTFKMD